MAGLYDDVVGGEYKGTSKWKRPQQAYGSMASFGGNPWGAVAATRNPWGGSMARAGYGGYQAPGPAATAPATQDNPWVPSQTWAPQNAQKPAYDINAAKRMAYLQGNVGSKGNPEWDYLNTLKGQTPGFQAPTKPTPISSNEQLMQNMQMLPQIQQYISQLGGLPGQPDNNERWKTLLSRMFQGGDIGDIFKSQSFWGGN